MVIIPIIAALLPVFILTSYTWPFDLNLESKGKLIRAFIYGAIICFSISLLVHGIFDTIAFFGEMELLTSAVCIVALIVFCIWVIRYTRTKLIEQLDIDENLKFN